MTWWVCSVREEDPVILCTLVLSPIVLELASDAANHGDCSPSLHLLGHQICDSFNCPTPLEVQYPECPSESMYLHLLPFAIDDGTHLTDEQFLHDCSPLGNETGGAGSFDHNFHDDGAVSNMRPRLLLISLVSSPLLSKLNSLSHKLVWLDSRYGAKLLTLIYLLTK